jgi:hypothetical protein
MVGIVGEFMKDLVLVTEEMPHEVSFLHFREYAHGLF